ncbi:putative serine/threonine protein kinase [Blattamonas nauphoetae]|uniref:Serine/threonine protein kinase n=1 Tax=Blattamonas nauphoetae TaxID=2049346 RepID=A0ABQ9XQA6_9EUKA|nr:putative serine/threonine protein kinase [Blattamonas nauphoetae]
MPNTDSPLFKLTLNIVDFYHACNRSYQFRPINTNQGNVLTKPSEAAGNGGKDNRNGDYIVHVGDIIAATDSMGNLRGRRYLVESLLGAGSFGQVLRCVQKDSYQVFAVKVIKNLPAYTRQAAVENRVLSDLLIADPNDDYHMLRLVEQFTFHGHFCFVTDLLGLDLYATLKQHRFKGFSLNLISKMTKQILECLCVTKEIGLIHSDLKPENILIDRCLPHIKVIDFGSAAYENHTTFTYVQSRYYRSPEVLLQIPYDSRIDMWSVGCITAELFIGHPLFPGCTEHDQIDRITKMLGPFPQALIQRGKKSQRFYVADATKPQGFRFISTTEYQTKTQDMRQPRNYSYIHSTLERTIEAHQVKNSRDGVSRIGDNDFKSYFQFINMCLQPIASDRLAPQQALQHPFVQGQPYVPNWQPPPYTPHLPFTPHPNGRTRDPSKPTNPLTSGLPASLQEAVIQPKTPLTFTPVSSSSGFTSVPPH